MTRRRLLLLVAAACLLLEGPFVVRWVTAPAIVPGPTLENFKQLHRGMTAEYAKQMMGRPPDEAYGSVAYEDWHWSVNDEGRLWLRVDSRTSSLQDGFYSDAEWIELTDGGLTRLRRWLGL